MKCEIAQTDMDLGLDGIEVEGGGEQLHGWKMTRELRGRRQKIPGV